MIAWIAAQPWCTGAVGMFGISWGGFNALQVAARRPPALKAIITCCSTDDRYADDTHYIGGCLLLDNLNWGANMFATATKPPDPEVVGEGWRDIWLRRLENIPHLVGMWSEHQRRDEYCRHGSVCEDFSDIECAVFAVGGWADSYTQRDPAAACRAQRAAARADRPLGARLSASGEARPGHRLPAGIAALVGFLAEGQRDRHHVRADAARLDAGGRTARELLRRMAGAVGGGDRIAIGAHQNPLVSLGGWRAHRCACGGAAVGDRHTAKCRHGKRRMVPIRASG